jgi:flagellar motor switch protein FliM
VKEELNSAILGGCDSTSTAGPDLEMLSGVLLVVERRLGLCWAFLPSSSNDANSASAAAKRAPERLSTVLSGVTSHRLRLGVGLGDVEIQVSDLLALQPGDVIRFPSQLQGSVPVSVAITGKVTQAALAQLGQQDGHLAVKFLSQHRAV